MTVCHRSEFQRSSTWRRFFFEKIFFEKMHQIIWVIIATGAGSASSSTTQRTQMRIQQVWNLDFKVAEDFEGRTLDK